MNARTARVWQQVASVLALLLATSSSLAQQVRVQAALSDDRTFVGNTIAYQIVIENAQDVAPPSIDAPPGLQIDYAGASQQPAPVMIVNGRRMDTGPDKYVLQYRVTPTRAGTFTIPSQVVRVGGTDFTVESVRLSVDDPPVDRTASLEATLSSETAYVGEPIDLTLTWLFVSDVRSVRFATAGDREGYDLLSAAEPRAGGPGVAELEFDGVTLRCSVRSVTRGGRQYTEVTARRTVVPTRAGDVRIGPFMAMAQVRTGDRNVGILLSEPVLEPRVTRSEPVMLRVLPLPTEGRPPGFTGLVGAFSIDAQASPTSVNVGDPIDFRVTIHGPGPLERVAAPDLAGQGNFARAFRLEADGLRVADDSPPGGRTFATTLRATSADVTQIPGVELPYFDTRTGRYDVARSDPIPLEVRATRVVTAADAVSTAPPGGRGSAEPTLAPAGGAGGPIVSRPGGLLANQNGAGVLRDERGGLLTLLVQPAWGAGILTPPLAFVAACLYRFSRGREIGERGRTRRATSMAIARLRNLTGRKDESRQVAATLRAYAGERLGIASRGVTSFDVRRGLGDTPAARQLGEILDRADEARLHGRPGPSAREAMTVVKRLAIDRTEAGESD